MMTDEHRHFTPSAEPHAPVLLREVVQHMDMQERKIIVDGTFGAGGHTRALLENSDAVVVSIDRDSFTQPYVEMIQQEFGDRFIFVPGRFGDMEHLLAERGIASVDGILLDIGVSSMQLDTPRRGFSFREDGPLDMRMDADSGRVAADLINHAGEEEIAGVIFKYGDERYSRKIARAIVNARTEAPITRTAHLADIVAQAIGRHHDEIHPATRTFQAIRMWVNEELYELETALHAAEKILAPDGRLLTITFHSGEDKIVKEFINSRCGKAEGISRYMPLPQEYSAAQDETFRWIERKVITPADDELRANPRSRSAKLRVAERTATPVRARGRA